MNAGRVAHIYRQWFRARLLSTIAWAVGLIAVVTLTAAFYPSLKDIFNNVGQGSGLESFLGLSGAIDPSSPLGFLWSNLYSNIVPWIMMALGIAIGAAAIAGDEEKGTLEYLLSRPAQRAEVVVARFAVLLTVLLLVALVVGIALAAVAPLFELTTATTTTAADGASVTNPGVSVGDIAAGTFAALAVGIGTGSIAFLLGAAIGRHGVAVGVTSGYAIAGYLLYTLSNVTGSLGFLTWISPWRWYVHDAMLITGLDWDVLLPFGLATICFAAGWFFFQRRDLRS